jgi:cytoskeletal protein CcmA (bactofilin family)
MAEDKNKKSDDSLEESSTVINPQTPEEKESAQTPQDSTTHPDDQSLLENTSATEDQVAKPSSFFKRIKSFANLYFAIFIGLLLLAAVVVVLSVKLGNKPAPSSQSPKTQSLSDKQISDLKGNTTLVGDAQQTLDIQGNAVFEGQVLMRNNLDVAGSIKVGGSLSLPAITVGGTSSFGQIQVNDKLSVNGNTTLQGQLNVQKGIVVAGASSFGSLSASQLNVSNLQLTGDLVVSRHINVAGGAPSRSNGSALGAGGTISVNGTDTAGTVTVNTGGSPPAGCFVTLNFVQAFSSTPHVIISPSNSSAGSLNYYSNRTTGDMSICTANAPSGSTTYIFDYIIID